MTLSLVMFCAALALPQPGMTAEIDAVAGVRSSLDETTLVAKEPAAKLPEPIINTLRQDISKRTGTSPKTIRVVESGQKTWPDGCLGLARPDEMCTQALVNGWRVVLSNGTRRWVYRTNASGKVFRLETAAQHSSPPLKRSLKQDHPLIKPVQIPISGLPPRLQRDVVFRDISEGGFAGLAYQTRLLKDGRLVRERLIPDGSQSNSQVRQLSPTQVRSFQQFLQRHSLRPFHRDDYRAIPGSADFITVTLTSSSGTVRYADSIHNQLPEKLKAIVQAWNEVSRFS